MRARHTLPLIGLASAALALAPALAEGSATASATAKLAGNCKASQNRPSTIILFCADANAEITKITWNSFGSSEAYGAGHYEVNSCTPNCAAGTFSSYKVTFAVSKPKPCADGSRDYQSLVLTFIRSRPPKAHQTMTFGLDCPVG